MARGPDDERHRRPASWRAILTREAKPPSSEPVIVFETGNPALLAVAKSLLESAGIEYFASGEAVQQLIGLGALIGFNPAVGPVRLQVPAEDADDATELLRDLRATPEE